MTRLKDIAQRAGVSVMTVSKALRDEPDVSAATKTRIKLLAQQMGYVPDSDGPGLAHAHDETLWPGHFFHDQSHLLPRRSGHRRAGLRAGL